LIGLAQPVPDRSPRSGATPVPALIRLLACLLLLGAAGCNRLAKHPLAIEATEEVQANARVAEVLGTPVTCGPTVRGTANEVDGIAAIQFDAKGPKGAGIVVVEGKKTRDQWGITHLELRPAGAEKLSLLADLEARTGTDTPKFDPAAKPAGTPTAPPPGDVEIALPPGVPGQ
jgi:hypothetical protein